MIRYANWAARLDVFLREQGNRKFQYGDFDCCLFVCEAVRAMTGTDTGAEWRGRYGSAKGAAAVMRATCGEASVAAAAAWVAERYGMPEIPVLRSGRGDVLLLKRERDYSLGIVPLDSRGAMVAGPKGVLRVAGGAVRAWKV